MPQAASIKVGTRRVKSRAVMVGKTIKAITSMAPAAWKAAVAVQATIAINVVCTARERTPRTVQNAASKDIAARRGRERAKKIAFAASTAAMT